MDQRGLSRSVGGGYDRIQCHQNQEGGQGGTRSSEAGAGGHEDGTNDGNLRQESTTRSSMDKRDRGNAADCSKEEAKANQPDGDGTMTAVRLDSQSRHIAPLGDRHAGERRDQ